MLPDAGDVPGPDLQLVSSQGHGSLGVEIISPDFLQLHLLHGRPECINFKDKMTFRTTSPHCWHHNGPLLKIDYGELVPVPEAAAPVGVVNLVARRFRITEDYFRLQDATSQGHEILPQRQIPGLHVLADLGIVVESVRELLQGLSPLDRVLPREGAHLLHQLEVGSLLIAEASHVAEFWQQVDGFSVSRPLLSDLNETIEDLRSK